MSEKTPSQVGEVKHTEKITFRSGFVAIVGCPNVGKSTLLNQLIGQKVSIMSPKPQTTRHRILGIKTRPDAQIIYVDTPGVHKKAKRALNRYLNKAAFAAMNDVDVIIWMVDPKGLHEDDELVYEQLKALKKPVILAINKIDKVKDKRQLLPLIDQLKDQYDFAAIVPISALKGQQLDTLEEEIIRYLPEGPTFYPEDQVTDKSERFRTAEIIREKLIYLLGDEIPYQLTVTVDHWEEEDDLVKIYATIWVERESQKPIVVGKGGGMLKKVGTMARKELEAMFGKRVFLGLWVKVKEKWSDQEKLLRQLGYVSD